MSNIYTFGYGYSKILCEDVTSWFLSEFFPRHKIEVDIVHKGLKREHVVGYCDVAGSTYRPRQFLIELQCYMSKEDYIKTLLHELTHMAQWVRGSLKMKSGKLCYSQEPVENYDYEHQPHEIEAREEEERLYLWYLNDRKGVPAGQVSHGFGNRLRSSVS